jgi:hypothetical protein
MIVAHCGNLSLHQRNRRRLDLCNDNANTVLERNQSNRIQQFKLRPEAAFGFQTRSGCRLNSIGLDLLWERRILDATHLGGGYISAAPRKAISATWPLLRSMQARVGKQNDHFGAIDFHRVNSRAKSKDPADLAGPS